MLKTLYSRLALTLFVLLCGVGIVLSLLLRNSSSMYQQEVMQKLNSELAHHIVSEQLLVHEGEVDRVAMERLFQQLMVVNPQICWLSRASLLVQIVFILMKRLMMV